MARVAVVGGGWAGLAAAVLAVRKGHQVTLFEAARQLGGRARALDIRLPDGRTATVDNGPHIFVGAYLQTLALMESIGLAPRELLHRMPLTLRFPDGTGLTQPDWPSPWDAVAGIVTARGWTWRDKLALLRESTAWQLRRFDCPPAQTVTQLCAGLTPRVMRELIEPLCVSALNTPAEHASAQVFLRVLRDALFGKGHAGFGGSNLLVPRVDLGQLFPDAAQAWLQAHGCEVRLGERIEHMPDGFDAVILACPPWEAERLVAASGVAAEEWLAGVRSLAHEAIATVYAYGAIRLPLPLMALRSGPAAPAQFVFDRGQLGGPAGLLAFVISASEGDRQQLQDAVMAQAAALGWNLAPVQTVVEKRATFACTPQLARPPVKIAGRLFACGDYVEGPYPATLEGAVRSAAAAVALI